MTGENKNGIDKSTQNGNENMDGSIIAAKRLLREGNGDTREGLGKETTAREEDGILDVRAVTDLEDTTDIEVMVDIQDLGILLTVITIVVGSILVLQFHHHGVPVSPDLFILALFTYEILYRLSPFSI